MPTYAPKSKAITAVQLKHERISNRITTAFCPEIGFFDTEIAEGQYGLPIKNKEGLGVADMLWGNPGDWLIKTKAGEFLFMSDENFREGYYRLSYSDPPGAI